jgi:hypothetical protein
MIKPIERSLPNWIDAWMKYTENTEPPDMFRFWTAISVIAAALQRKCFVKWGPSLTFYPNLYIVLVGPSGVRKGTAMNPGLDILQDLGKIEIAAQATTLQALIRRLKDTNYQDPDARTGDLQFHSSMMIYSKEFTVFLGYHNRELMSSLCDWYDCDRSWKYETISRKTEEIVGVWVNLYGATTPTLIQSSLPTDAIGGGLTSRIIYIYEEVMGKMVLLPMENDSDTKLRELLLFDLDKISRMSGHFTYTEDFLAAWSDWRVSDIENPPFHDDRFDGYMSRRPTHVMKLSMVLSAARGDMENQMALIKDDFDLAVETLEKAELKMQNVFGGMGKSDISSMIHKAMMILKTQEVDEISVWKFMRMFQGDMDKATMDRVLATLEVMKAAKVIHKPQADDVIKVLDTTFNY